MNNEEFVTREERATLTRLKSQYQTYINAINARISQIDKELEDIKNGNAK